MQGNREKIKENERKRKKERKRLGIGETLHNFCQFHIGINFRKRAPRGKEAKDKQETSNRKQGSSRRRLEEQLQ